MVSHKISIHYFRNAVSGQDHISIKIDIHADA